MATHNGRTAIVTGASQDRRSHRPAAGPDGFAVVVDFASKAGEADALVEGIRAEGGSATAAQADVSDPRAMRRLFDEAEAAFAVWMSW